MKLKTNYKNARFSGNKKYRITSNSDGTVYIDDETNYSEIGTAWGADDINATNSEINRMQTTVIVEVPASGWSATYPYTKEIAVQKLKSTDYLHMYQHIPEEARQQEVKDQCKSYGKIIRALPLANKIRLECVEKPQFTFYITLEGVDNG